MVRRLAALALIPVVAIAADRLAARARGWRPPDPMHMLVVIDAPIDAVWSAVADVAFQTKWMTEMKELVLDPPGRAQVGQRGEATVRILGIALADLVEVTEVVPPTRYAIRHLGLFKGGGVITLEPGADGATTVLRWEETLVPPLLPQLGALVQAPILRAIFQADLERLKRLVETGTAD
ncbi:MAG: SRPBCC family protein [Candidatus Limnocylindrales bacterium]